MRWSIKIRTNNVLLYFLYYKIWNIIEIWLFISIETSKNIRFFPTDGAAEIKKNALRFLNHKSYIKECSL
jgi:hypothetical protein